MEKTTTRKWNTRRSGISHTDALSMLFGQLTPNIVRNGFLKLFNNNITILPFFVGPFAPNLNRPIYNSSITTPVIHE